MRNAKPVSFGIFSTLAVAIFLFVWYQNLPTTPLIQVIGTEKNENGYQQNPPASQHGGGFVKSVADVVHLGYQKVVYSKNKLTPDAKGSVLIISSIANENSFGLVRTFGHFYDIIDTLEYEKSSINLSFYCGSAALFKTVTQFFDDATKNNAFPYKKITLLYAPFLQSDFKASDHNPAVQTARRRSIARGRNFVLLNSLDSEEYTLFLDADIVRFDNPDMLARFVKSGKDIIVPRVERGGSLDYDRNSWRGHRIVPTEEQFKLMDEDKWEEAAFVSMDIDSEMYHLGAHVDQIKDLPEDDEKRDLSYLVDLDSVGGAVLFAKSVIYKQGAIFPTYNAIGTSWSRKEGFDGIETEGLCYMARSLGYGCYAMPNLVAQHFFSPSE